MQRKTVTYTRYRPILRVLSAVSIPSIRVMMVGIENPAQNDDSGPLHARVQLIRILHDRLSALAGATNRSSRNPRNVIARLGRGLVTKPSTVIENMILK